MTLRTIQVLTDIGTADTGSAPQSSSSSLGAMPSFDSARRMLEKSVAIGIDELSEQISSMYNKVTELIDHLPESSTGTKLQSVSFTLTISAGGEVSLLSAAKGKLEGSTGLSFTVVRGSKNG